MGRAVARTRCNECGRDVPVRHVLVRMYVGNRQRQYKHVMCQRDLEGLDYLLRDNAVAVTASPFDYLAGFPAPDPVANRAGVR